VFEVKKEIPTYMSKKVCMWRQVQGIMLFSQVAFLISLAGCSRSYGNGGSIAGVGGGPPSVATPQMVYMMPAKDSALPPSPDSRCEIAVMNLDGTGQRQLTNDGKFKFLPHFSPDGSKVVYAKFAVGGYGSPNAQTDVFVYDLASG
jgi:hypothetical protein